MMQYQQSDNDRHMTREQAEDAMSRGLHRFMVGIRTFKSVPEEVFITDTMPRGFGSGEATWARLTEVARTLGFRVERNLQKGRVAVHRIPPAAPPPLTPSVPKRPPVAALVASAAQPPRPTPPPFSRTAAREPDPQAVADRAIWIQELLKKHCAENVHLAECVRLAELLEQEAPQPQNTLTLTRLAQIRIAGAKERGRHAPDFLQVFEAALAHYGLREDE